MKTEGHESVVLLGLFQVCQHHSDQQSLHSACTVQWGQILFKGAFKILLVSTNATQPVPGNNILAANLMARAWNSSTELHTVTTIDAAKSGARKWAQNLPVH